jgi:hypothetical protein
VQLLPSDSVRPAAGQLPEAPPVGSGGIGQPVGLNVGAALSVPAVQVRIIDPDVIVHPARIPYVHDWLLPSALLQFPAEAPVGTAGKAQPAMSTGAALSALALHVIVRAPDTST